MKVDAEVSGFIKGITFSLSWSILEWGRLEEFSVTEKAGLKTRNNIPIYRSIVGDEDSTVCVSTDFRTDASLHNEYLPAIEYARVRALYIRCNVIHRNLKLRKIETYS